MDWLLKSLAAVALSAFAIANWHAIAGLGASALGVLAKE